MTDRKDFARAADAAEARFGKLHILCNNAGVAVVGPTALATFADWDWVMGVNLGGTINGVVTILPRIRRHGEGGHIVNTASMSGLMPHPGATIYGTSKGAAVAMMECMRHELEPEGIICSAFCPGAVQSNIAKSREDSPVRLGRHRLMRRQTSASTRRQLLPSLPHQGTDRRARAAGILNDEPKIITHSGSGRESRTARRPCARPYRPA